MERARVESGARSRGGRQSRRAGAFLLTPPPLSNSCSLPLPGVKLHTLCRPGDATAGASARGGRTRALFPAFSLFFSSYLPNAGHRFKHQLLDKARRFVGLLRRLGQDQADGEVGQAGGQAAPGHCVREKRRAREARVERRGTSLLTLRLTALGPVRRARASPAHARTARGQHNHNGRLHPGARPAARHPRCGIHPGLGRVGRSTRLEAR